jgi:hypothetical protein
LWFHICKPINILLLHVMFSELVLNSCCP